jgi:hypothetical protein
MKKPRPGWVIRTGQAGAEQLTTLEFWEPDHIGACGAQKVEKPIMSRLAIAFVLALASVAANAQDTKSD